MQIVGIPAGSKGQHVPLSEALNNSRSVPTVGETLIIETDEGVEARFSVMDIVRRISQDGEMLVEVHVS